ncbi:MAG: Adenylate isopentenyltransferase [Candidatus Giovannonibacteria bacterium GW2011_GWA2_44_13b]|uniref:Adenylate isopentenyltransferase n=2 Tax=Candidatus Giovannoniibacteriota TaxID=1752738 RepID=A0A0G1K3G6_9BACT|nr:MAG: Adenylate isopentenyltransferase [Candidatus Giovannonibacteria bacterium GW2011_GWA2_44_13b]
MPNNEMKYYKAIAIIGPTCAGKTEVAVQIAKNTGLGEMVNMDKMFLFKHFRISSGLTDLFKENNIKKHLYELLEPDEEIIPPAEYIQMMQNTCSEILSNNRLPILEGGSTTYVPAFLEINTKKKFCWPVIGLRFSHQSDIRNIISQRLDAALKMGLLDETKENIKKYKNSLGILDGHAVVPLVRYFEWTIDLAAAKEEIITRCLNYIHKQMDVFTKYPGIIWLEHKPTRLSETVKKIKLILQENER